MFKDTTIIVGVTGGIAAYKACEVVRRLTKLGAEVWVVMTEAATKLVSPLTFRTLSGNPVITDLFSPELKDLPVPHIKLTDQADLILVVPATANIIGKAANAIADDPLSTILLAAKTKKLFAPAMNTKMWNDPVVEQNIGKLEILGIDFVGPVEGSLACGDRGEGKLSPVEEIINRAIEMLVPKLDLKKKRILVTAGGTREPIDPVRFIGNRSSGKMGYTLAQAARERGAKVTLISAPTNLVPPLDVEFVKVQTAADMKAAVLEHFKYSDALIMAAAVSDFKTARPQDRKTKKAKKGKKTLILEPTDDILAGLKRLKRKQFVVGFALETENMIKNAKKKLKAKGLDLIVANDPSTFDGDLIKCSIIDKKGRISDCAKQPKEQTAHIILDHIKKPK